MEYILGLRAMTSSRTAKLATLLLVVNTTSKHLHLIDFFLPRQSYSQRIHSSMMARLSQDILVQLQLASLVCQTWSSQRVSRRIQCGELIFALVSSNLDRSAFDLQSLLLWSPIVLAGCQIHGIKIRITSFGRWSQLRLGPYSGAIMFAEDCTMSDGV
jgi:hypothetical protein